MSEVKFCPHCGNKILPEGRFCGDCGYEVPASASGWVQAKTQPPAPPAASSPPIHQNQVQPPAAAWPPPARQSAGSKGALIALITILAVLFLGGGGLYWWLSREADPARVASPSAEKSAGQVSIPPDPAVSNPALAHANLNAGTVDLTRASSYLSEPGLKCTFFVNYPDGMSAVVERISARVTSAEAVRVSEVETGVEQGEAYGYGFHYVERADGTYYIMDQSPMEIFPVLKNNLSVGKTWNYQDEFGTITWTVLEMGVDLDLGFASFKNCLVVRENNQAAGFQSITYYAPGRGSVLVRDVSRAVDYSKMTALSKIDEAQAAAIVKQWSPNYRQIKDDRSQN